MLVYFTDQNLYGIELQTVLMKATETKPVKFCHENEMLLKKISFKILIQFKILTWARSKSSGRNFSRWTFAFFAYDEGNTRDVWQTILILEVFVNIPFSLVSN